MKTRKVKPCGMLYSQGREYFLLTPIPIKRDWELDTERRFVVVPRQPEWLYDENSLALGYDVYPHARHIISNSFTLEYADMPEINIKEVEFDKE